MKRMTKITITVLASLCYGPYVMAASAIPNPFLIGQKVVDGNDVVILQTREDDANMESQTSFHLNQLHVEGYDVPRKAKKELSQIEKKYNNRDITMEDLQLAVAEVTECYRKAGLPAATAYLPEQESYDGTIHIKVEPGRYGTIQLDNRSHVKDATIQGLLSTLHEGEIIDGKKLETVLNNVIDLGGVRAGCILRPGQSVGESDIVIPVEDGKRESFILYSENYGSRSSGRYRYGFSGSFYEMQGKGDRLTASMTMSNQKQHNYGLQYEQLTGDDGTKIGISLSKTDYELGSRYADMGAVGDAYSVGVYGVTPIYKTSQSRMGINYGWTYRKLKDEMKAFDYEVKKHSQSFYFGVNGLANHSKTRMNYDFTVYAGQMIGDSARVGDVPLRIANQGRFTKAVLNGNLLHGWNEDWDMLVKFQGQKAASALDSSEQFYLGGANGVRAYPQGEGSGDEGYQASAELRYHTKVPGLLLSTFFDMGHVNYNKGYSGGTTLKGWGVGASWNHPKGTWLRLDYARRIGLSQNATDDAKSKQRIWFIAGKSW